jgi:hypothetical protein
MRLHEDGRNCQTCVKHQEICIITPVYVQQRETERVLSHWNFVIIIIIIITIITPQFAVLFLREIT